MKPFVRMVVEITGWTLALLFWFTALRFVAGTLPLPEGWQPGVVAMVIIWIVAAIVFFRWLTE